MRRARQVPQQAVRRPFIRTLAWTLLIQGSGSALALLTVVWLGWRLGPESQGVFSRTKTELEFLLGLGAFGLPQALLYFVQSGRLTVQRALRISVAAAIVGALCSVAYSAVRGDTTTPAALALTGAVMIWHGHVRAVLLGVSGGRLFNAVTAMPQALVFAGVVATTSFRGIDAPLTVLLFSIAFLIPAALAHVLSLRLGGHLSPGPVSISTPALLRYGAATWMSAVGINLSVLLTTLFVSDHRPAADLGLFTSAIVMAQLLLAPVNYAVPLLFKRWVDVSVGPALLTYCAVAASAPLLGSALLWMVSASGVDLTWLGSYSALVPVAWIILLGVALEVGARLLAVALLGAGRPWRATFADAARAVTTAALLIAWGSHFDLQGFVMVWAAGSLAALLTLLAARPWADAPTPGRRAPVRPTVDDQALGPIGT